MTDALIIVLAALAGLGCAFILGWILGSIFGEARGYDRCVFEEDRER